MLQQELKITVSDIGSKSGEVRLLPLLTITHLNNVWGFASYNAAIATKTQKENKLYWAPSDNWNFHSIFLRGTFRHTHRLYLQVHSMLPCACSVVGPGWRQNVVETEMLDEMRWTKCVKDVLSTSVIYYWTDTWKHEICLLYLFIYLFMHGISDFNKSLFHILRKWQSTFCLVLVSKYVGKLFM